MRLPCSFWPTDSRYRFEDLARLTVRGRPRAAHRAVPRIDRNGRNRRVTRPIGLAQDRSPSWVVRPDRVRGRCVIAPRRSDSAYRLRPWRFIAFNGKPAKPLLVMICEALGEYGQCSAARRRYSRFVNCNFHSRELGVSLRQGPSRLDWKAA